MYRDFLNLQQPKGFFETMEHTPHPDHLCLFSYYLARCGRINARGFSDCTIPDHLRSGSVSIDSGTEYFRIGPL